MRTLLHTVIAFLSCLSLYAKCLPLRIFQTTPKWQVFAFHAIAVGKTSIGIFPITFFTPIDQGCSKL